MASRYWVGGTDLWNGAADSKWSSSSGGAGGEAAPTADDDVFFDENSGIEVVTVSGTQNCRNLDCTGFAGGLVGDSLNLYGSLDLSPFLSAPAIAGSVLSFLHNSNSPADRTLNPAGQTLACDVVLNADGDTLALASDLTIDDPTMGIEVLAGTFDAAGFNITAGYFSSGGGGTRTVFMRSGTWTLTATGTTTIWLVDPIGLTFLADESTILIQNDTINVKTFNGGGLIYNDILITGSGQGEIRFTDNCTFNLFRTANEQNIRIAEGKTIALTAFMPGETGGLSSIDTIGGTGLHTFTKLGGGTVSIDHWSVANSQVGPETTWYAGANSVDAGGNTGYTFLAAEAQSSTLVLHFYSTQDPIVDWPDNMDWTKEVFIDCVGKGYNGQNAPGTLPGSGGEGGGGGAFSRKTTLLTRTESYAAVISVGGSVEFYRYSDDATLCFAPASGGKLGALASACVGDTKHSGGDGGNSSAWPSGAGGGEAGSLTGDGHKGHNSTGNPPEPGGTGGDGADGGAGGWPTVGIQDGLPGTSFGAGGGGGGKPTTGNPGLGGEGGMAGLFVTITLLDTVIGGTNTRAIFRRAFRQRAERQRAMYGRTLN